MIRPATHADIGALLVLAEQMHGESKVSAFPFAVDRVGRLLAGLVDLPTGCLLVAEREGEIIGGFAGWCDLHWACDMKQASDFALFVAPGKRGGLAAARLIQAFKAWAHEQGADQTQIGISTGVRVNETTELFKRMGFETIGPIMELQE